MLAAFTDFERREDVSEKLKSLSLSSSSSLRLLFSPFSEFSLLWRFLAHLGGEFFSSWERTTMSSSPSSSTLLGLSMWVCISERTTLWLIFVPLEKNFCFLCRNETFTHHIFLCNSEFFWVKDFFVIDETSGDSNFWILMLSPPLHFSTVSKSSTWGL